MKRVAPGFPQLGLAGGLLWLGLALGALAGDHDGAARFQEGTQAYRSGEYAQASATFRDAASRAPAAGTLRNLGNAEWQLGHAGTAILAWEQSLWLNPFSEASRINLQFARKTAQIESPDLTWYEVVSTWLPVNWWVWLAGGSLWLAVGMALLPGLLRCPKTTWQQALAAFGLMIFLLSLPALQGVRSRSRLGFVLEKNAPLRLTPTEAAQFITRLQPGEPVRCGKSRGKFVLVRASRTWGWLQKTEVGTLCPADSAN